MTDRFNATTNGTILVVDDSPENLTALGELLQPVYRVLAATSGPRALQLAASEPRPDLILLDLMMPTMDGYAVMERLCADPRTRSIPVIFVTAMNATEEEECGLALGAVDYIVKPFKPAVVLARVRTHMELKRARDRLQDQNAFLEAEVQRRTHENEVVQDASIHAIAKEIALHHHEKWDGSGYPDGLAADAIPFPARLMALADVFDAVISRRVYKEPLPFARARSIIRAGCGCHFDPDVVMAFESDFDRFCAIAQRYGASEDELHGRRTASSGESGAPAR